MWDQRTKTPVERFYSLNCVLKLLYSFNLLFLTISHKKFVIFTLFYLQCILMKCETNIEIMTYIVTWLPNEIHSVWKTNKLDIPCRNAKFCKFLWWPMKGSNLSLKVSAHRVDGLWQFILAETIIMFDLVLIFISTVTKIIHIFVSLSDFCIGVQCYPLNYS